MEFDYYDDDDDDDDGCGGGDDDDQVFHHFDWVGNCQEEEICFSCDQCQTNSKLEQIVPNHVMHSMRGMWSLEREKVKPHTSSSCIFQIAKCICTHCKMYLIK